MTRLHTLTFDINSTTIGLVEWATSTNGSPAIETASPIHGTGSLRINNTGAAENIHHVYRSGNGKSWIKMHFQLKTGATTDGISFFRVLNSANAKVGIRIGSAANGNKLKLYNEEDGAQVGSDSAAISVDEIHYVELYFDSTTLSATAIEAKLDGTTFASGTIDILANPDRFLLGTAAADATYRCFFDSVIFNDDQGSYQNTWPGDQKTLLLRPDGMGDNDQWARGGTDSGSDNGQVDENPPNGATDYIESNTAEQIDDFTLEATPAALGSGDTVTWVGVGPHFAISSTSGADPEAVLRIKDSSGGTVDETPGISGAGSTAYINFLTGTPRNYPVFANSSNYERPGTSSPWTKAYLDTAQIGVRESITDTHFIRISTIWLCVSYLPSAGVTINLNAAAVSASGQTLSVVEGAVTKNLSNAALTASGQSMTVSAPPPAQTVNLASALLNASGQAASIIEGAVTILLSTASATAQGQALSVVEGGVIKALAAAALTAQGQTITVSAPAPGINVNLSAAALAAQGQTLSVIKGAVSIALAAAALTAQGQTITVIISGGPITIDLSAAALSALGQVMDVVPGAVTRPFSAAQLIASGQALDVIPGTRTIPLSAASLIASGQTISIVPGAVLIALQAAIISALGQDIIILGAIVPGRVVGSDALRGFIVTINALRGNSAGSDGSVGGGDVIGLDTDNG